MDNEMKKSLDLDLTDYYTRFRRGHDRRRQQLMNSLTAPQLQPYSDRFVKVGKFSMPQVAKMVLALAAGLLIVLGLLWVFHVDMSLPSPNNHAVWAAAIEQAARVQSVHFRMTTYGGVGDAGVEMWWRRPHDFRMEMSNITTMAGNGETLFIWNEKDNSLVLREAGEGIPLPALFILGNLGKLFTADDISSYQQWIDNNRIISSKLVTFKGQKCLKVACVHEGHRYEYLMEQGAGIGNSRPFLEVKEYGDMEGARLLSHLEVLAVDEEMPDNLFVVEPPPGAKVLDRRPKI